MSKISFDHCDKSSNGEHHFKLLCASISIDGKERSNSHFECEFCKSNRTASEKFQLDSLYQQEKFLKDAKFKLLVMTISVVIGMSGLVIAVLTFLSK
jgi:hypothetical protein